MLEKAIMKKLFYSRVSTVTQSVSRQFENLKQIEGFDAKNFYYDKIQGNIPFLQRPQAILLFDIATSNLNEEVEIFVDSIDRLGRNTLDILHTIELFSKNKIRITFLKESFTTLLENGEENPTAKLVLSIMAVLAEMDRDRLKLRAAEGIKIAKANGLYKGRKIGSIQTDETLLKRHQDIVHKLQRNWTIRAIATVTGKSFQTICKVKKTMQKRQSSSI